MKARKGMSGRAVGAVVDRGLLFKRISDLEGVVDVYDGECLVRHLREFHREYACKKLIPFTQCVKQAVEDYRRRQRRPQAKRKQGEDGEKATNDASPSSRDPKRLRNRSSGKFSSCSSSSAADEEEVFDAEVKPEFDLMKSSIRDSYSETQTPNRPSREVDVQEDSARVQRVAQMNIIEAATPADSVSLLGNTKGSELGAAKAAGGPMFRDIGGIEKIIDELIMKVAIPLYHPQLPKMLGVRPISGILLHGPPGCGKTKLARAIANETEVRFYEISATEIVSGVSGASEENIRELFKKAYRTAPSIVFIDEIDAIGSKRDNLQREMEKRIVTQLMTCMDESHQAEAKDANKIGYVLVIGATNRPDALDPALRRPGRFDYEIFLGVPDEKSRREILSLFTEKLKLYGTIDLSKIAKATPGFVGADLVALVNEAGYLAMRRIVSQRKIGISDELLKERKGPWWKQPWMPDEMEKLSSSMVDFEDAAKLIQPSSRREGFSSIPAVKWEDVGGLDSLRKEFDRHIVRCVKNPEKYEKFGVKLEAGFLLYGPPGCGKTLIAKAVANEAGANFIHIKGPELLNKYVGESELAVRTLFGRARTCSPCVLFFDEIDAVTARRGKDGDSVADRLLAQLIIELDGADPRPGVFVIAATNRPEAIDPTILRPGRLDRFMFVPLPSPEERIVILKALTRKKFLADDVDLVLIAQDCENFSGADLSFLVNEAAMLALEEEESTVDEGISSSVIKASHFNQARMKRSPSVSAEQRKHYENLSKFFKPT